MPSSAKHEESAQLLQDSPVFSWEAKAQCWGLPHLQLTVNLSGTPLGPLPFSLALIHSFFLGTFILKLTQTSLQLPCLSYCFPAPPFVFQKTLPLGCGAFPTVSKEMEEEGKKASFGSPHRHHVEQGMCSFS